MVKRLIMNFTCKGEIVASSPPDSEISLWSLSNCWIWSSMLLSKFCNIFSYILPSNSLLNASPVFLPSLSLPAVWCWTWWGPCPPPSPLQSTPPYPGRQASGRKTLKWSRTYQFTNKFPLKAYHPPYAQFWSRWLHAFCWTNQIGCSVEYIHRD